MATVNFIKYKRQSAGALSGVTQYVSQEEKIRDMDGRQLVSGQNCTPQLADREFQATRGAHRKDSPVWFYHYVQSFSPDEVITGEQAHQLAKEFAAKAWPDSEVLIATHLDAEHIHSHFVVNAVCWESGKMLRQGPNTLHSLRQLSDELCLAHGFSVLPQERKNQTQGMGTREYRSAAKGQSWKFRLMNTIEQCMMYAASREEFLSLMRSEGYEVCWIASRKYITYTTPQGMRCRDDRLHENKYRKEQMEREFRIRAGLITGGVEAAEPVERAGQSHTPGVGGTTGAAGGSGGQRGGTGGSVPGDFHPGGEPPHPGPVGGAVAGGGGAGAEAPTGWEEGRAAFLAAQAAEAFAPAPVPGAPADPTRAVGLVGGLVQLEHALERAQDSRPVADSTLRPAPVDHKAREQERQKRLAMGHKADDHAEEPVWKLTP